MNSWPPTDTNGLDELLSGQLTLAANMSDALPADAATAIGAGAAELSSAGLRTFLDSQQRPALTDALMTAAQHLAGTGRDNEALAMLYAAHELARGGRAGGASRQMRHALQLGCGMLVQQRLRLIESQDGEASIDDLLTDLRTLIESASGGQVPRQLLASAHESILRRLEEIRGSHPDDLDFERRLVRNNIAAVLSLTLPQHMKAIQATWQDIARHVAPHALRFAEQQYAIAQSVHALLGDDALERLEQAVSEGTAGAVIGALADVEDLLLGNLRMRLEVSPDWLPPEGQVFATGRDQSAGSRVPDPDWLKAKNALERGQPSAIEQFRNIDFRHRRNLVARMWHAYALARLGKPSDIHEIIEIYREVIAASNFMPRYHATSHWNLAVALSRVPGRLDEALDALLPILDFERHPADSLDLALLWATGQGRADVSEALFGRCRYHEAHILAALSSARDSREHGDLAVAPEHLRRLAAILRDPDHEFPHPVEEIRVMKELDNLVADFIRLQLLPAGIEWFRQRVTYPRESNSFKNWECLGELYERAGQLESSWHARRRSVESTIRAARKQRKPEMASRALTRLLTWGMRNNFREQALQQLRRSWRDTALGPNDVAVWEEKLAPRQPGTARPPDRERFQDGGQQAAGPGPLSAAAAREITDRLAPQFDGVSQTRQLAAASAQAGELLAAADAMGRSGPAAAMAAVRSVVSLAVEFEGGVSEDRARSIDAEMREQGQLIATALADIPLESRALAKACLQVIQGLAAQVRGVPDLSLTLPHALRMRLDEPPAGGTVSTRLAVRVHNPAVESAASIRAELISESDQLTIMSGPVTIAEIPAGQDVIIDFEVQVTGTPVSCALRCHVIYQSVGVERAVHARGETAVQPWGEPIPVTERFVTAAPVNADRVDLFHGRDRELAELKGAFSGGQLRRLYFVNGIRRVGKSSLMRHLGRVCEPEILTLVVDFDMDKGLDDKRLIRELLRKAEAALHASKDFAAISVRLPGAAEFELDAPWRVFEDCLRDLQRQAGRTILVCFDELQEIVARIADPAEPIGDSMLSWMRGKIQQESDLLFICTGSESYEATKRRVDSRLWGNMQPYNVSFVDRPAMERIVTVPLKQDSVHWLPETLSLLWDLTEGHPWVTQILAASALTALNREHRRVVLPGDIDRAADEVLSGAGVSDLWWNEEEGLVTQAHRQVAFLILRHQPRPRSGVTTDELFQACARSGIHSPGSYVDAMAALELLTCEGEHPNERWRIRGGFLERYLERLLARVVSETRVDTAARTATQPLGVFLDVENIKKSLLRVIEDRPPAERDRLARLLRGEELGVRLLRAAARHGNPIIKWAVANWHVGYLEGDQMAYKSAGFQPDIAGKDKADASDHVLKEHIHDALRDHEISAFVIGTGDGDYQAITQTLQSQGKYLVLWATRDNMSNAFGANLRGDDRLMTTVEFLEDFVFADADTSG